LIRVIHQFLVWLRGSGRHRVSGITSQRVATGLRRAMLPSGSERERDAAGRLTTLVTAARGACDRSGQARKIVRSSAVTAQLPDR
jgi:hypothetical protein